MSGYAGRPPLPWFAEVTDPLARFADEARPLLRGVIADIANYASGRIVVLFGGARLEVIYPAPPAPVVGQTVEFYKMRAGRSAYLALPQTMAPTSGIMGTFVLAPGSVGAGDAVFTPGVLLAADAQCWAVTLVDFDHNARFYPRMWKLDFSDGGIKVVFVPAGTPAGTIIPIEYRFDGVGNPPVFEGQLDWGYCQLITQEADPAQPPDFPANEAGDAIEVRGFA